MTTRLVLALLTIAVTISLAAARTIVAAAEEAKASDPRLQGLIGTWEGNVRFETLGVETRRTLVVREREGQLDGRYGIPGKKLETVNLTVEFAEGSPLKVSFVT